MTKTTQGSRLRLGSVLLALAASVLLASAVSAPAASAASETLTSYVKAGDYRTLVTLWNTNATGVFRCPAGAKIRVKYGGGWFSYTRQNQTLNCETDKRLSVGRWSVFVARMQIKVPVSQYVTWGYIATGP